MSSRLLTWHFPLARPHAGIALGNGLQGLLVWGEQRLNLTLSRAGFWDRRSGHSIPADTTYARLRKALEADDAAGVRDLFPPAEQKPGYAPFPQQFGGGRLEITFAQGLHPIRATLDLNTGLIEVWAGTSEDDPALHLLHIRQSADNELCWIRVSPEMADSLQIRLIPVYDLIPNGAMAALGIAPPEIWSGNKEGGFRQTLPADEPLCVAWRQTGPLILLATALGDGGRDKIFKLFQSFDPSPAEAQLLSWWDQYWARVPRLDLPDSRIQELYDYGLFRQAGLIRREAPPATLQGPWMEDTRIPPWSNDYHFNINLELVYGAALATNHHEEMESLWVMLKSWFPALRARGEQFYGLEGAMLLPHAVDDRGQIMGEMWTGTIDQACLAWMGQLAWQTYRHTLDEHFLREIARPLLQGAFLGYFAMLEKIPTTKGKYRFSLPVSVSPELGGSELGECWGRDASFQLAALHATARYLQDAATALGEPFDPRWRDVASHLPLYTLIEANSGSYTWLGDHRQRIAIWQGQDLVESHRHHSHLAAIHPFQTVDPFDPAHQRPITHSLNRWNTLGAGNWTGWCLPWASQICTRCGLPDAALCWLHLLEEGFTNEGRATLHNANHAGVFGFDDGSLAWPDFRKGPDYLHFETMQMDAAMGAIQAILDLLVRTKDGVICLAERLPTRWRELSFAGIRVEGAFLVSAVFRHARVHEITVESLAGQPLRLRHAFAHRWTLDGNEQTGPLLEIPTEKGVTYFLRALPP